MLHKTVKKIHSFRIFFLCFIILAFLFNIGLNPVDLSVFFGAKIGRAVGMDISVPENPFNKLAAQLKEKENNLALRERELDEREMLIREMGGGRPDILTYVMGGGIVLLFMLILLNYYLDYARKKNK